MVRPAVWARQESNLLPCGPETGASRACASDGTGKFRSDVISPIVTVLLTLRNGVAVTVAVKIGLAQASNLYGLTYGAVTILSN